MSVQVIEGFKADAQSQQSALEAMIEQHRQAECARHDGLMSESPVHGAPAGSPQAGPLQMTAGTSQLAAEMDQFIRHTQASGGAQVTVLKQVGLRAGLAACLPPGSAALRLGRRIQPAGDAGAAVHFAHRATFSSRAAASVRSGSAAFSSSTARASSTIILPKSARAGATSSQQTQVSNRPRTAASDALRLADAQRVCVDRVDHPGWLLTNCADRLCWRSQPADDNGQVACPG